MTNMVFAYTWW